MFSCLSKIIIVFFERYNKIRNIIKVLVWFNTKRKWEFNALVLEHEPKTKYFSANKLCFLVYYAVLNFNDGRSGLLDVQKTYKLGLVITQPYFVFASIERFFTVNEAKFETSKQAKIPFGLKKWKDDIKKKEERKSYKAGGF